jgi:hypothetical protein
MAAPEQLFLGAIALDSTLAGLGLHPTYGMSHRQSSRGALPMRRWKLWVRIEPQRTTFTYVFAPDGFAAKSIGEAQFGIGNVLSYTEDNG